MSDNIVLSQTLDDDECRQLLDFLLQEDGVIPKWQQHHTPLITKRKTGKRVKRLRREYDSNRGIYHFYDIDTNEHRISYRISELANMAPGKSIYRRPLSWRLRTSIQMLERDGVVLHNLEHNRVARR